MSNLSIFGVEVTQTTPTEWDTDVFLERFSMSFEKRADGHVHGFLHVLDRKKNGLFPVEQWVVEASIEDAVALAEKQLRIVLAIGRADGVRRALHLAERLATWNSRFGAMASQLQKMVDEVEREAQ